MPKRRDWTAARAKVDQEARCRVCGARPGELAHGRPVTLEAAHTLGREHDQPIASLGVLFVDPRDVVPLCGPAADSRSCHYRYDRRELSLLEYLSRDEQASAVGHVGLMSAYRRLAATRDEP